MISLLAAELLKATGTLVTAAAAIYAVYSDRLEKIQDGRLTTKGRILIAVATLGLLTSLGAQTAQYYTALESAESARRRNEQTAAKLREVADRLELEALAATPLRRLTLIAYFNENTTFDQIADGQSLSLSITIMRGSQSEFRLKAYPSSANSVSGLVQLEGREQRVTVSLDLGATNSGVYENFKWRNRDSKSLWVDLGFRKLIASFEASLDGQYQYWPYQTAADLKDVWLIVSAAGTAADQLASIYNRLNEDLVIVVPPLENGSATIRSVLRSIRKDSDQI